MRDKLQFKSIFIKEFRPGKNNEFIEPKMVYHYTSSDAFLNIIKNGFVRFSDIRYMNDKSEMIVCVKRIIEFIEERGDSYPAFRDSVKDLLSENDLSEIEKLTVSSIRYKSYQGLSFQKQRNYILCASKDSDSLNMWNYYASNRNYTGYNIGLSIPHFLKTFDVEEKQYQDLFSVYYGDVLYDKKQQFNAIEELAQSIEKNVNNKGVKYSIPQAATFIRCYIELQGVFFKDSHFKSEKEFRFLFSIAEKRIPHCEKDADKYFGVNNKKLCEDFCVKNGLVVPYMKVILPTDAISRITMAPMTETEIAKDSIKELLTAYKFKSENNNEIPVYKSEIPIRY